MKFDLHFAVDVLLLQLSLNYFRSNLLTREKLMNYFHFELFYDDKVELVVVELQQLLKQLLLRLKH